MRKASMKNVRRVLVIVYATVLAVLTAFIFIASLSQKLVSPSALSQVRAVEGFSYEMDSGESGAVSLPYTFKDLKPRTTVTLYADIATLPRESLLVKTVYAPLRVYADEKLIYECGQEGTYPAFMLDPPTMLSMIPLPEAQGAQRLRFEFVSPSQRDELSVSAIFAGEEAALFLRLLKQNAALLAFSLIFILLGLAVILARLTFLRGLPSASSFLYLGLIATLSGLWGLGECNLTAFLLPYPSLLYVMAFTGLFGVTIPVLRFGIILLKPKSKLLLNIIVAVNCACFLIALILQLTGIVGFSRSMYLFHVIEPLSLVVYAACIILEYVRNRNKTAAQFLLPIIALAGSAVLEVINYQFRITSVLSLFFQSGMLIFIVSLLMIGMRFMRGALRDAEEKIRLELEMSIMNRQLDIQREQYKAIAQNAETIKAQRHDLRHHLAVIKGYSTSHDMQGLNTYLEEWTASIAQSNKTSLCENFAVNAIALHYLALAEAAGIATTFHFTIPASFSHVQDTDLCIIIGNFLENAIEACGRVTENERFIKLNTRMQSNVLTITMDNSFDGYWQEKDGVFLSRKHDGEGIGLTSVQAVVEKYGGRVKFEAKGNVFLSSAYIHVDDVCHSEGL